MVFIIVPSSSGTTIIPPGTFSIMSLIGTCLIAFLPLFQRLSK